MNALTSPPTRAHRLLLALVGAAPLVLIGCGESAPQRVDTDATVTGPDMALASDAVVGRSFTDTSEDPETSDEALDPVLNSQAPMDARPAPAAGGGMPSFVDPNLAAGLREDPGKTAAGTIEGLVTFGDLSLLGADIDELLDYIYKPDTENAKRFKFPEKVLEAAGDNKAIVGYMIALEYKPRTNDIISFMLVRDLQSCCFGGVPRPDEWIMVEMEEGKSTEYFMYVPVTVRGKFTPGRIEDDYGYASAIYNLEASSVERYEAPVAQED